MSLNPADLRRLKDAFNEWAKNVPDPDQPAFGFLSSKMYSAKEIAKEIEHETPFGKDVIEMVESGINRDGIDATVARITRKPPQP